MNAFYKTCKCYVEDYFQYILYTKICVCIKCIQVHGTALGQITLKRVYTTENHSSIQLVPKLYLLSIQIRRNIKIHSMNKRKQNCTVGFTIMISIYSLEVSTIRPNYKSQKFIKMLKNLTVICITRVGCSTFHISFI